MAWFNSNWKYRRRIEIDPSLVAGTTDFNNFPILVEIIDNSLKNETHIQGWDIVFTNVDGVTIIPHEIELLDRGVGRLLAWVKVPLLKANAFTQLYVYFGNPAVTINYANGTAVWSNESFVYHCKENPYDQSLFDSSAYNRLATPSGFQPGDSSSIGVRRGIKSNDSTNRKVLIPYNSNPSKYELHLNIDFNKVTKKHYYLDKGNIQIYTNVTPSSKRLIFEHKWSSGNAYVEADISNAGNSYVVIKYDGTSTSNAPSIFINGVNASLNASHPNGNIINSNDNWTLLNSSSSTNSAIPVGGNILFLASASTPSINEQAIINGLISVGYTVTVRTAASSTVADATGKILIIFPSNSMSTDVGNRFKNLEIPFLAWEPMIADDYDLSTNGGTTGISAINITDPEHYVANNNPAGTLTVYNQATASSYITGIAASARIIATADGQACIAVWEVGDQLLNGFTAQERRGFFFFFDNSYTYLNSAGQNIAYNLVKWMINRETYRSPSGILSEVRLLENNIHTDDWTKTEYLNESSPSTFAIVQEKELLSMQWYDSNWTHRKRVFINNELVSNELNNFVALVYVSDPALAKYAKPDASDILFTTLDTAQKLSHEVVTFNSSTGELYAWVKVPYIASTVNTYFYIYFGNPNAANQQNLADTWSDYVAVWHMSQNVSPLIDSTGRYNGTFLGAPAQTAGIVGSAVNFDGTDDRISVGNINPSTWSGITLEAWFYKTAGADYNGEKIICQASSTLTSAHTFGLHINTNNQVSLRLSTDSQTGTDHLCNFAFPMNSWQYIAATWDGPTDTIRFYANGNFSNGSTKTGTNVRYDASNVCFIGNINNTTDRVFTGGLDEIRISSKPRLAEEIKTQHNMMTNPSQFLGLSYHEGTSWEYTGSGKFSIGGNSLIAFEKKYIWKYRVPIRINGSQIYGTTNHEGFVVLIDTDLPDNVQAHIRDNALSTGYDFVFTTNDGETKIPHEIEHYDYFNGQLRAWVRIPVLTPGVDNTVYLYYGHSNCTDQQDVINTWDSKYLAVYHLREIPTVDATVKDSSRNNRHASFNGGMIAANSVSGKVYKALDFDGTNDFLNSGPIPLANVSFTISTWTRRLASGTFDIVIGHSPSNSESRGLHFGYRDNNYFTFAFWGNDLDSNTTYTDVDGQFHNWVGTYNANTNARSIYRDGVLNNSNLASQDFQGTGNLRIGGMEGSSWNFRGLIDEVRIMSVDLNSGWVRTEYNNINTPNVFSTIGQPEAHWRNTVGKIKLTGEADYYLEFERSGSGKTVTNGESFTDVDIEKFFWPTGNMSIKGTTVREIIMYFVEAGQGGITTKGQTQHNLDYILFKPSSGLKTSGKIDFPSVHLSYIATGKKNLTGTADYYPEFYFNGGGNAFHFGNAQDYQIGYVYVATPTTMTSGGGEYFIVFEREGEGGFSFKHETDEVNEVDLTMNYFASGKMGHIGIAARDLIFYYTASGKHNLSGRIEDTVIHRTFVPTEGKINISGSALTTHIKLYWVKRNPFKFGGSAVISPVFNHVYENVIIYYPLIARISSERIYNVTRGEYVGSGTIKITGSIKGTTTVAFKDYIGSGKLTFKNSNTYAIVGLIVKSDFAKAKFVGYHTEVSTHFEREAIPPIGSLAIKIKSRALTSRISPKYIYSPITSKIKISNSVLSVSVMRTILVNGALNVKGSSHYYLLQQNVHKAFGNIYLKGIATPTVEVTYTGNVSGILSGENSANLILQYNSGGKVNVGGHSIVSCYINVNYNSFGKLFFKGAALNITDKTIYLKSGTGGITSRGASQQTYSRTFIGYPVIVGTPRLIGAIESHAQDFVYLPNGRHSISLFGKSIYGSTKEIVYSECTGGMTTEPVFNDPQIGLIFVSEPTEFNLKGESKYNYIPKYSYTARGAVHAKGKSEPEVFYKYPSYVSSGTIKIRGISNYYSNDNYKASWGLYIGGTAQLQINVTTHAVGTLLHINGSAESTFTRNFIIESKAEINLSGIGAYEPWTVHYVIQGVGGGFAFGTAPAILFWNIVPEVITKKISFTGRFDFTYDRIFFYFKNKIYGRVITRGVVDQGIFSITCRVESIPIKLKKDPSIYTHEKVYGFVSGKIKMPLLLKANYKLSSVYKPDGGKVFIGFRKIPPVPTTYKPNYEYIGRGIAMAMAGGMWHTLIRTATPSGGIKFAGSVHPEDFKKVFVYNPSAILEYIRNPIKIKRTRSDYDFNLNYYAKIYYKPLVLKGITNKYIEIERISSGTLELKNSAISLLEINGTATGKVVSKGNSVTSNTKNFIYSSTGKKYINGAALTSKRPEYKYIAVGKLNNLGGSTYTGWFLDYKASGKVKLSGLVIGFVTRNYVASGKTYLKFVYTYYGVKINPIRYYAPVGKISLKGSAPRVIGDKTFNYESRGRILCKGSANNWLDLRNKYVYVGSGRIKSFGYGAYTINYTYKSKTFNKLNFKSATVYKATYIYDNYEAISKAITTNGGSLVKSTAKYCYINEPGGIRLESFHVETSSVNNYNYNSNGQMKLISETEVHFSPMYSYRFEGKLVSKGNSESNGQKYYEFVSDGKAATTGKAGLVTRWTIMVKTNGALASVYKDSEDRTLKEPLAKRVYKYDIK